MFKLRGEIADLDADCTLTIDFEHGRDLVGGGAQNLRSWNLMPIVLRSMDFSRKSLCFS